MKQIAVISGKGGTGKTMVSGALASLAKNKVLADCDVDAANLHLLLNPKIRERHPFKSGQTAVIEKNMCTKCRRCIQVCRFQAIAENFSVDPVSCEGCGLCAQVCPASAVQMNENTAGEWFLSETKYGPFVHAKLGITQENSGKLAAHVRETARNIAETKKMDFVIIDGPPGIGCPVIASLSGIDLALVVTEPSLSGFHDAKRVVELAENFKVPVKIIINKFDINPRATGEIEGFCDSEKIPVVGKIPFEKIIIQSVQARQPVTEYAKGAVPNELCRIWEAIHD